ncbi:DUF2652 domain-containing protein [Pedobacter sp. SD-b]|uniref:DUF2652 domain-containing protein n=1 Tax=Pedobacter segetis TaxID=2793069 RepID=A0ABS1BMR8_9SPHI|nr:DUF2652 domain-containing protein [Pedobacter segetis]MBK0384178.1 DUF2652 domain-containing protein [Pedobacter segetis]
MNKKSTLPVFFCIPDLTGFTRFMTSTDPEFANKVITALLNKVIAANILEMNVAEIEGDAIFFYRTGRLPAVGKIAKQCTVIFETFNDVIASFEKNDNKNYEKYLAKNQLGIKIIIHYGHINITKIQGRVKLLGEDVILVHKLLKNSIAVPCYILLTDNYLEKIRDKKVVKNWFNWEKLKRGKDKYDHFGVTYYSYIALPECKDFNKNK